MKSFRIIHLTFVVLAFLLYNSCSTPTKRMENFEVHGIDVSHYQGRLDWSSLPGQDVHFAFIKATEGEEYKDSLFCRNWLAAQEQGILRGAYHFFRPSIPAHIQVDNFTSLVEYEKGDLPPVLDFEATNNMDEQALINRLHTWLVLTEEHTQMRPIIYTNLKLYNKYIRPHFKDYIVWIARYNDIEPDMPFEQNWTFWQYGNQGQLKGIEGDVDFNVFHGDYEALKSMTFSPVDTALVYEPSIPIL